MPTTMRALVVDDIQVNRRVLQAILSKYGPCDTAESARQGITFFQEAWKEGAHYNLICLDIMMPEIDGIQLLEIIRKIEGKMNVTDDERARVFMVTAKDDLRTTRQTVDLGADATIVKPIDRAELLHYLRKFGLVE